MTWVATAIVGSTLISGYMQSNAAQNAANAQMQAANTATGLQRDVFNTINQQQEPYRQAGYGALTRIQDLLPQLTRTFTNADLTANLAPNYEWQKQQGIGAATQLANVGGGGSNVLKSGIKFAEDYSRGAYQDALNNWRMQQGDIYNRLAGIAGIGQTAQTATNVAGTNAANAIGQLGIGGATAYGAGQVGSANAWGNVASSVPSALIMAKYFG